MEFKPFCQTEVLFLSLREAIDQLIGIVGKNIVFIMNASAANRFQLDNLPASLSQNNKLVWINAVKANPTQEDIHQALHQVLQTGISKVDMIIAVGGGSIIDLAKCISAFYDNSDAPPSLEALTFGIEQKTYQKKEFFIDIIAIPTTAGTGSELTQWATVWDIDRKKKYSIDHIGLKPKIAYIIPELTLTLPKELTLSSGLDAFSHAVEAYWSKHTNPLVQELAYRAIQLILEALPRVLVEPGSLSLREDMCRASVLAGMAFSHTRTTACHSISYPLTMLYGIPHGIAAAMTLGEVSRYNMGSFPNSDRLFALFELYGDIQSWLDEVCSPVTKLRLSAFHIKMNDIDSIVTQTFTSGRMDNNPIHLSNKDIKEILIRIY